MLNLEMTLLFGTSVHDQSNNQVHSLQLPSGVRDKYRIAAVFDDFVSGIVSLTPKASLTPFILEFKFKVKLHEVQPKENSLSAQMYLGHFEASENLFLLSFSKLSSLCNHFLSAMFIYIHSSCKKIHRLHLGASNEGRRSITFPGLDVHRQWFLLICLLH